MSRTEGPLSNSQQVLYDAVKLGTCTILDLTEKYYQGVKGEEPEDAVNTVRVQLHYIRKKTGANIKCRGIYRIE